MTTIETAYIDDVRDQFRKLKKLAEGALAQVNDDQLHARIDDESNSVAIVMKHMSGLVVFKHQDAIGYGPTNGGAFGRREIALPG